MTHKKSIFIFHRSLRLHDNNGLLSASNASEEVIPIFIFTPDQITSKNKFRSINAIKFMVNALKDLDKSLRRIKSKLFIFYGKPHIVLDNILNQNTDIDAVYINMDYTPYAIDREERLKNVTEKNNRYFISIEDYLLHPINKITNSMGSYYSVFTPFYRNCIKYTVDKPRDNIRKNYVSINYKMDGEISLDGFMDVFGSNSEKFKATRRKALQRIHNIDNHKEYADKRDIVDLSTTLLSPYIKFGLLSIREVYHRIKYLFGKKHDLIKQLYWREFYFNIVYNRRDMLESKSFRQSYDKIKWNNDYTLIKRWKNGMTGCPIVDAGMRELNNTGYMHNRSRLVTSNYLIKHLLVDWRIGERYFASKLVDYDPSVNNGNWQFSSGSGASSQPYFRVINPWLQGRLYDPQCEYIKKWIPELKNVRISDIHDWENKYIDYKHVKYPEPLKRYDFKILKKELKKVYAKAFT